MNNREPLDDRDERLVRDVQAARDDRFARKAWILLDWAASGFSTLVITLVVAYVQQEVLEGGAWGLEPDVIWAWTLAAAMLFSAVLVPWVAAWADRRDAHREAVIAGTVVGAGGLLALAIVPPGTRVAVLGAVIVASIGFDVGQAFAGSLLAKIADGDADRLSARGFAAGYAGGAIALVIATTIVTQGKQFGLSLPDGLRLGFAATAAWWLLFSLPAAFARFGAPDHARHATNLARELLDFARGLLRPSGEGGDHRFAAVLAGAMLSLGGIQTAIAQFTSLAMKRFSLDGPTLVVLVLLVQAVALPGALGIGWLTTRFGRRPATAVCLGGWIAVLVLACFVRSTAELYWLAALLAVVLGGAQSLLRAAVAAVTPQGRSGVTFGLLQVGTKLAGSVAGIVFGAAQMATGVLEAGLVTLIVQLAAGWWLLRRIR